MRPLRSCVARHRRRQMTLGIRLRPHDFRRCAAVTAAFRGRDMPHLASALLQHRDRQVTDEHYNRSSSMLAGMKFGEMVSAIRGGVGGPQL